MDPYERLAGEVESPLVVSASSGTIHDDGKHHNREKFQNLQISTELSSPVTPQNSAQLSPASKLRSGIPRGVKSSSSEKHSVIPTSTSPKNILLVSPPAIITTPTILSSEEASPPVNTKDLTPLRRRSVTPQSQQFSTNKKSNVKETMKEYKDPRFLASLDENTWSIQTKKAADDVSSSMGRAGEFFLHKSAVVRVRPFIGEEKTIPRRIVSAPSADRVLIVNPNSFQADPDTIAAAAMLTNCAEWAKDFRFSHCLWSLKGDTGKLPEGTSYATQESVYQTVGENIVQGALIGESATCIAYGHTGTGKTYTMFGTHGYNDEGDVLITKEAGLIPRVFSEIMNKLDPAVKKDSKITISFLEIYNERLRDLLRVVQPEEVQLRVREHPVVGTYVENLIKVEVSSPEEILRVLSAGVDRRTTQSTARNFTSSRSHAVVTLEITSIRESVTAMAEFSASKELYQLAPAKMNDSVRIQMVDLAGSEQDFTSENNTGTGTGNVSSPNVGNSLHKVSFRAEDSTEKTEMKLIRKSLSTLGYIIKALSKGASSKGLPYRDSILTWLLKDSLISGKCHTCMLATISPSHLCYEETLSTLKYAQRLSLVGKSSSSDSMGVKWADQLVEDNGVQNIQKLQDDLGGNKRGTEAARILLKQTLNDPQQRLAKLNFSTSKSASNNNINHSSSAEILSTPKEKRIGDKQQYSTSGTSSGMPMTVDLRDSYRALRAQSVELQIELETARADRDSLLSEIQALREAAEGRDIQHSSRRIAGDTSNISWEQEKHELRATIARKDDNIDKLLTDLASEKLSRVAVERLANAQMKEYADVTTELQTKCDSLSEEIRVLKVADIEQREAYKQLESLYTEKVNQLKNSSEKSIKVLEDGLHMAESRLALMTELRDEAAESIKQIQNSNYKEREIAETKLMNDLNEVKKDRDELLFQREQNAKLIAALTKKVNDMETTNFAMAMKVNETEMAALISERDALLNIIEQQNRDHTNIQRMSQASLQMLHQRQGILDEKQDDEEVIHSGIWKLQDTMQSMLSREGDVLQAEIMDATRLTEMITSARKNLNQILKYKETAQLQSPSSLPPTSTTATATVAVRNLNSNIASQEQQQHQEQLDELLNELNFYKKAASDADNVANYWKSIASSEGVHLPPVPSPLMTSASPRNSTRGASPLNIIVPLSTDVETLQRELTEKTMELEQTKKVMNRSQLEMQKEFASLWLTVQQLSQVDATKDHVLNELKSERDRIASEKQDTLKRFKKLKDDYKRLQDEVDAIDDDLLNAIDAEGISIEELLNQRKLPIEVRRSSHEFNISASAVKSRVRQSDERSTGSHSELGLERQITQLSTFLSQEKLQKKQQHQHQQNQQHHGSKQ